MQGKVVVVAVVVWYIVCVDHTTTVTAGMQRVLLPVFVTIGITPQSFPGGHNEDRKSLSSCLLEKIHAEAQS